MNEKKLQRITTLKFIASIVGATLYAIGGMEGTSKGLRRVGTSLWTTLCIVGFSLLTENFHYLYLLYFPLCWATFSLGYGGKTVGDKILRRLRVGVLVPLASLPLAIVNDAWIIFGLHFIFFLIASIVLGVINPVEAREEETILGWLAVIMPLFMI